MYYVYVIYNERCGKIYIGQTEDLDRRMNEHNNHTFTSSYTARYQGNWSLIYKEEFNTRKDVLIREKQLKSFRGRKYLKQYIPR